MPHGVKGLLGVEQGEQCFVVLREGLMDLLQHIRELLLGPLLTSEAELGQGKKLTFSSKK